MQIVREPVTWGDLFATKRRLPPTRNSIVNHTCDYASTRESGCQNVVDVESGTAERQAEREEPENHEAARQSDGDVGIRMDAPGADGF